MRQLIESAGLQGRVTSSNDCTVSISAFWTQLTSHQPAAVFMIYEMKIIKWNQQIYSFSSVFMFHFEKCWAAKLIREFLFRKNMRNQSKQWAAGTAPPSFFFCLEKQQVSNYDQTVKRETHASRQLESYRWLEHANRWHSIYSDCFVLFSFFKKILKLMKVDQTINKSAVQVLVISGCTGQTSIIWRGQAILASCRRKANVTHGRPPKALPRIVCGLSVSLNWISVGW